MVDDENNKARELGAAGENSPDKPKENMEMVRVNEIAQRDQIMNQGLDIERRNKLQIDRHAAIHMANFALRHLAKEILEDAWNSVTKVYEEGKDIWTAPELNEFRAARI